MTLAATARARRHALAPSPSIQLVAFRPRTDRLPASGGTVVVKCPACDRPLVVIEREGIEVDWCTAFDSGELELLAELAQRDFTLAFVDEGAPGGTRAEERRRCPRCRQRMDLRNLALQPPVPIDLCPAGHGIWFDRGELGTLLRALPENEPNTAAQAAVSFLGEMFQTDPPRVPDPEHAAGKE
jgi:Zn-finger nucleic acid-binding protein